MVKENLHTALSGKLLDNKLIEFESKCKENQRAYYSMYPQPSKVERVFVILEDISKYNSIENKTKTYIISFIEQIIQVRFF